MLLRWTQLCSSALSGGGEAGCIRAEEATIGGGAASIALLAVASKTAVCVDVSCAAHV